MIVFNKSKIKKTLNMFGVEATFPPGESTHAEHPTIIGYVIRHPGLSFVEKEIKKTEPVPEVIVEKKIIVDPDPVEESVPEEIAQPELDLGTEEKNSNPEDD